MRNLPLGKFYPAKEGVKPTRAVLQLEYAAPAIGRPELRPNLSGYEELLRREWEWVLGQWFSVATIVGVFAIVVWLWLPKDDEKPSSQSSAPRAAVGSSVTSTAAVPATTVKPRPVKRPR